MFEKVREVTEYCYLPILHVLAKFSAVLLSPSSLHSGLKVNVTFSAGKLHFNPSEI